MNRLSIFAAFHLAVCFAKGDGAQDAESWSQWRGLPGIMISPIQ